MKRRSGDERRFIKALPAIAEDERRKVPERRKRAAKVAKPPAEIAATEATTANPAAATRDMDQSATAQTTGEIAGRPTGQTAGQTTGQITAQTTGQVFVPAQAVASAAGEIHPDHVPTFRIDEVQAAQRHYNECPFVTRVRDVRRSLGKPKANVTRMPGPEPLAVVTICWDIVWYQYLVDLRRDLPVAAERVTLYREGMDLDELPFHFREKNAVVNDDGKLDASELEVRLLSDPSTLITEMVPEETQLMDDLTEETWGSRVAPEFKWDD
jgi:hypothetical protein